MARMAKVSGMPTVLKNLSRVQGKVAKGAVRGLIKGGLFLQSKSQEIVPKQIGDLYNTAFTRNVGGSGADADIIVGYTADYAVFVHEDLTKAHGKEFNIKHAEEITAAVGTKRGTAKGGMFPRGENEQAKFLEKPARENRKDIINMVAREARRTR